MKFAYPIFLILGIAASAVIAGVFIWTDRRNQQTLSFLASQRLLKNLIASVSLRRRILKRILLILSVLCIFAAGARPQWGFRWEEVKRRGVDILFAMDVSKSMLTQDVKPDRLARAKLAVFDLVRQLTGDRVGLIAFSGSAFLQCPLTLDYEAFAESLDALDTSVIPKGGTDIASAIQDSELAIQTQAGNHKILILITDGEDLEGRGISYAQQAAQNGLKIFTVGVGTASGDLIPVKDEQGGVQFAKDSSGQIVKSRLDAGTLEKIAEATGGFYVPLGARGEGLEKIYRQGLSTYTKEEFSSKMQKVYLDRFQWPLALAILFLVLEFLIHDKKSGVLENSFEWLKRLKIKNLFQKTAILIFLFSISSLQAGALKDFEKGNYPSSEEKYRKAWEKKKDSAELNFNLGDATYKNEKYDEAANLFQRALSSSNLQMQQKAYYNLGNTQYRLGQQTEQADRQQTISRWQQAVQSYESSLKLNPKDENAKFNLEFVKKKLEELQKQQQQDQKNQQDKKDQQKQDQSQNQQQQDQDSQQNQDQQKQEQKNDSQNQSNSQQEQNQKNDSQQDQQKSDQQNDPQKNSQEKSSSSEEQQKQQPRQNPSEERRKPGEMTKEEAENLLNAVRDEQARPEKVRQIPAGNYQEPDRDW